VISHLGRPRGRRQGSPRGRRGVLHHAGGTAASASATVAKAVAVRALRWLWSRCASVWSCADAAAGHSNAPRLRGLRAAIAELLAGNLLPKPSRNLLPTSTCRRACTMAAGRAPNRGRCSCRVWGGGGLALLALVVLCMRPGHRRAAPWLFPPLLARAHPCPTHPITPFRPPLLWRCCCAEPWSGYSRVQPG
jgi:hypothetical protein